MTDDYEDPSERVKQEINLGRGGYRNYTEGDYADALDQCQDTDAELDQVECIRSVRSLYKSFESGRFNDAMGHLHKFVYYLDEDERELFFERHPTMCEPLNNHASITGYAKFDCEQVSVEDTELG